MLSKGKTAPTKSDRPESSVLISLNELRRIENERVEAEADARRARAETERQAKAEADQRTRDEETRRVRDEEERRQRTEREGAARQREERLRAQEAAARARVDVEIELRKQQLLDEHRQRHVEGRRFGGPAWLTLAAAAFVFAVIGGRLAVWASRRFQVERNALDGEIARRGGQARTAQLAVAAQIRALEDLARRPAGATKTANQEARTARDLERQKRPPRRAAPPTRPTAAAPIPIFRVPQKPQIDDEPLGGLPAGD